MNDDDAEGTEAQPQDPYADGQPQPQDPYTEGQPEDPYSGKAAKAQGFAAYEAGDYNAAAEHFRYAMSTGDFSGEEQANLCFNVAQCYHGLNDPTSAYEWIHEAIKTGVEVAQDLNAFRIFYWATTGGEFPAGMTG